MTVRSGAEGLCSLPVPRELIRCLKWYMDRSAELVRQDHIQEAMRVGILWKLLPAPLGPQKEGLGELEMESRVVWHWLPVIV